MTENELDDHLKKRISEVFDQYMEDTAAADEGWLLLRQKFPVEKKKPVIATWGWRGAAAALILLFLGWELWMYNSTDKPAVLAGNKPKLQQQTTIKAQDSLVHFTKPTAIPSLGEATPNGRKDIYAGTNRKKNKLNDLASSTTSIKAEQSTTIDIDLMQPKSPPLPYSRTVQTSALAKVDTVPHSLKEQSLIAQQPATVLKDAAQARSREKMTNQQTGANQNTVLAQQTIRPGKDSTTISAKKLQMADLFATEQKALASQTSGNVTKPAVDKRVLFSLYAGSFFNYAEGSKSQVNAGAGFTSDIKIAGNLKFSTGLAIARNTLSYNGEPGQANVLSAAIAASKTRVNDYNVAASSPAKSSGFAQLSVAPKTVVSGYNVSLTGLDIPINLKYEFNPKKTDTYILAGLSSGTFISEKYNYQYANSSISTLSDVDEATTRNSFNRFDFARTLNLALGVGYQLTKSNRLIIEPFFKYPLEGLGSQQIRFGSGGINLKLKFAGPRK